MTEGYRNAVANYGASLIKYIGLVDDEGIELSGGSYAREPVTWTQSSDGVIRPNADLLFDIPAGSTVGGWRGYSAATGGINYGGEDLTPQEYTDAGEYRLRASGTGIKHLAA